MAAHQNRQRLFRFLEKTLKERDKFQSVVLRVSEFGLVQMTRKRSGKTLVQQMLQPCNGCHGLGLVKSVQTQAFSLLRAIRQSFVDKRPREQITISVHPDIFGYLVKHEYPTLLSWEKEFDCKITLATGDFSDTQKFSIM